MLGNRMFVGLWQWRLDVPSHGPPLVTSVQHEHVGQKRLACRAVYGFHLSWSSAVSVPGQRSCSYRIT
jgi:hypothetical protein